MAKARKFDAKAQHRREVRRKRYARKKTEPGAPRQISKELCDDLAKILMAGIPVEQAMQFVDPTFATMTKEIREKTTRRWLNSPFTLEAISLLNGGDWHHLEKEQRLRLAYDKHLAELAYMLFSKSYATADPATEAKLDSARTAIAKYLEDSTADPEAPWMKAIRELYEEGKIDGLPLESISKKVDEPRTRES